jgi:hypothetical protein
VLPIDDVDTPGTPGYWMQSLWRQLQAKQKRLDILDRYRRGRPPLVLGSEVQQSAFYRFQRIARSNFADLIVSAPVERMAVRSIRTAAGDDDNGDQVAWGMWSGNNLDVDSTDVHRNFLTFSEAYVSVGVDEDNPKQAVIVGEDPRQVITAQDPVNPRKTLAAFKIFHDEQQGKDFAYLWLPGQMIVASRVRKTPRRQINELDGPPPPIPVNFTPAAFDIDENLSEQYAVQQVPVVRFGNRDGVGEFELHLDLLDRINHMLLQRVVIATLQAFRQRAIQLDPTAGPDGGLPKVDDQGQPINYDDLFKADPGALWTLPVGAKIWESGIVDLTAILSSVKDDAMHLAAVTRTPFPMFTPDAANQSAEGAQLTREGLVFKVEDRDKIAGRAWAQVMSLAFAFTGDTERADLSKLIVDWQPAERYSLSERAQADSLSLSLPAAQKYRLIWGMSPDEVQIALAQRSADQLLQATLGPTTPPPPQQPREPAPASVTGNDSTAAAAAV